MASKSTLQSFSAESKQIQMKKQIVAWRSLSRVEDEAKVLTSTG